MRLFSLVVLGGLLACASAPVPPASIERASARDVTTVEITRTARLTLHVDTAFAPPARDIIRSAAAQWFALTQGNVRFDTVFDLDFEDEAGFEQHLRERHNMIVAVPDGSTIVAELDLAFGTATTRPLAATAPLPNGATAVYMLPSRIPSADAEAVVTHELGHVIDLPDLPTFDSIMSAVSFRGRPRPTGFTAEDVALCRAAHYCR